MSTCLPFARVAAELPEPDPAAAPLPWQLASIAHEISQPLTAILSDACASRHRLDAAEPDFAEIRASLDAIVRDAERAGEVLARIRMLAAPTHAAVSTCELEPVIGDALAQVRVELEREGIELRCELSPELPRVRVDAVGLCQVVVNLVRNAIEACRAVPARRRRIVVRAKPNAHGSTCLEIEDAGVGIPVDPRRLFEPYYTTTPGGLGIGLTLSRAIVQGRGGRIWASRNAPHGATFHVVVPTEPVTEPARRVAAGCHPRQRRAKPPKISSTVGRHEACSDGA